ncbi:CHAT domain-containing protein [Actinomycetes bacterium KLBMP 9797]
MGDNGDGAQHALDAVQRSPQEAVALARRLLARTAADGPTVERATAQRAIGLALRELHDLAGAERHLRRSIRTAERAGSPDAAALSRMSLGYALASNGRNVAALRAVSAALARLSGLDAGRARMQRGVVLHYCGRHEEAARDYGAAVEIAQQEGDLLLEARARNNRGVMQTHRGSARALDDLERSAAIFHGLGLPLAAADVRWNMGIAAARRGAAAEALRIFAAADQEYRQLAVPRPGLQLNRLELLLSIPLIDEAAAVAAAAVAEFDRRQLRSDLAEALLGQARVALLADDLDRATTSAGRARRLFRRQGRHAWALLARSVELHADFRRGARSRRQLSAMVRTADELQAAGWPGPALTTRIEAARVAGDLGRTDVARDLLRAAGRARRGGTAGRRAQGWYATALLHRLDGDDRAARTALRRGLVVMDAHRALLGATELRASSGAQGQDLALEGLRIALGTGRPALVLAWAERRRATALRMTPVSPPRDPALADALAELRGLNAATERAVLAGRGAPRLRRQAHLEQQIRELTRRADGGGAVLRPPSARQLAGALDDRVLVELVAHNGQLRAVVVRDGRATLHDVGQLRDALHQLRLQHFALRRLVVRGDSDAARAAAAHAAATLDQQLLAPIRHRLGTRPLVVVPVGELHALAWSALPTCVGRPVTVAPSAAAWLRAARRPVAGGVTVLAAGPRLPEAEREVAALAAAQPDAALLTDDKATVDAVLTAMNGARLAHLAAHGTFRSDNPLLSTIELADGPLTAYELERLTAPPGCVVLSACESGLSAVHPGDELMGLSTVLLGAGTRSLIVSLLPVPADRTTELMLLLHARMRAGDGPAPALAAAQVALAHDQDGVSQATAAAFTCLGAG